MLFVALLWNVTDNEKKRRRMAAAAGGKLVVFVVDKRLEPVTQSVHSHTKTCFVEWVKTDPTTRGDNC